VDPLKIIGNATLVGAAMIRTASRGKYRQDKKRKVHLQFIEKEF